MNIEVFRAFSEILIDSFLMTLIKFFSISSSFSLLYLRMIHRLWIGSIILEDVLQLNTNLVESLQFDIIILKACWAPSVKLSASSKIIILVIPLGTFTDDFANDMIVFLTTSIPLQSEAFNSLTAALYQSPRSCLAIHNTLDVFPVPGGPVRIK